mmetsp:Transcript_26710/g.34810  ORF Transcript_26710/g.34810 Transcript_26710/m.34810 type:complete len:251 (+) Transcript_26710:3-755(+)
MSESVVTAFHSPSYRNSKVFLPKKSHEPNVRPEIFMSLSSSSSSSSSPEDNVDDNYSSAKFFRFLGRGENAIVRPGVVLIAPLHENSHFLMKSAVFIHAMGINEFDEYVIRGVIIDHPTPFTMTEMANLQGPLGDKLLYRGGEVGNDSAMMLHSIPGVSQSEEIGTSGVYEGGLQAASDMCGAGTISTDKFKFFFQFTEWTETQLENMLAEVDSDGDGWASVEVSSDLVLSCELDRSDAWSTLRNKIREM